MESTHPETQAGTASGDESIVDDPFYFEVVGEMHGPTMRVRDEGVMEDYYIEEVEEAIRRSGDEYLVNAAARQSLHAAQSEPEDSVPSMEKVSDPMAIERARNYLLSTVPRLVAKRLAVIAEHGGDIEEVIEQLCDRISVL